MEWFGVSESEIQFSLTLKTAGNSNDPFSHLNSSFFHGKFKKYSARLGKSGYIIKVRQEPFDDLPAMEFLCNQIARFLQLNTSDFYLIKLEGKIDAFVSKNFMEEHRDANLIHLYRYMEERPFNLENIMGVIIQQTNNYLDVERFIHICLFDILIGNHDRHGRNLAFIQTPKSKFLAPFYDNPSYLGIEEEWLLRAILEPCGKIHTSSSSEPKMKDYANEFCKLGYYSIVIEFAELIDINRIEQFILQSFISPARKQAFLTLIRRRFHELENVLELYETLKK
ncbi:MAG: HipA domain-containing protein [Chlamydiales bacterium]|nr:HipA domain-containing protein [Chlamydiales bacterium]